MFVIIGFLVSMACIFGVYIFHGGNIGVILTALPFELITILGAAMGAFFMNNQMKVVKASAKGLGACFKGSKYTKSRYMELLALQYDILQKARKEGLMAIEQDVENPDQSPIFKKYPTVGSDNLQGGYLATRHLIQRGCRHIAFFGDVNHPEAGLRYQGYLKALQEAGLTPDPRLHQSFLFSDSRIRAVIDQWLDQHLEFDAIFASSDVCAVSILGALSERGIAVPTQVKLVGYDDIALAEHMHPSLSSVRQPYALAGRALVDLLFEAIAGQPRRNVVLPTELIERESSR